MPEKTANKELNELDKVIAYGKARYNDKLKFLKEAAKNAKPTDDGELYLACGQFIEAVDFLDSIDEAVETVENFAYEDEDKCPCDKDEKCKCSECETTKKTAVSVQYRDDDDENAEWEDVELTEEQKAFLAEMITNKASNEEIEAYLDKIVGEQKETKEEDEDSPKTLAELFHKLGDLFED